MKFVDPAGHEPGTTRTAFHKTESDLQIAIEELAHTLAQLGYILVIKNVHRGGGVELEAVVLN